MKKVKVRRMLPDEIIDLFKKQNSDLKKEINQKDNKLRKIREASGKITGIVTGELHDNR